ncbi:MAG: cobyrinate a,c-diamide synthase [Rhodospirillales bacterium]|nr:cobyrinate a,c-diamide synthase [Rhodospirillales bacterium]
MRRLVLSAAHKSSGKTTLTLGLLRAFADRGLAVQPFKKGPDYIDPLWHGLAAGRPSWNLDFFTMGRDEIAATFAAKAHDADLALVEGNKGLYDGMDVEGADSSGALAHLLKAPVVLVIDTRGMTRGVAPLVLGYRAFDPGLAIKGVILNQVAGPRHEKKLREALARYADIPVLGALARDPGLVIAERHLGLVPANEASEAEVAVARIAKAVADQIDLERLLELAEAGPFPQRAAPKPAAPKPDLRIGIARDAAFGFYYPDDLEAFAQGGARLVPFDTLGDAKLPEGLDGLFIGGGFPETHLDRLAANRSLIEDIRGRLGAGLPAYAECGGLMYLARSIRWGDRQAQMVGAIPGEVVMHDRPMGRGYVQLEETGAGPWPLMWPKGGAVVAHEFHHSTLEGLAPGGRFAYRVARGAGIDGAHDGLVIGNLVATYAHLRQVGETPWVDCFLAFVRQVKKA